MSHQLGKCEYAGALSDIITAFDETHEWFEERAHNLNYFNVKENQIKEFIAHASELHWQGNPIFAKAAPSLYREMKKLYGKFYKNIKNKQP